MPRRRNGQQNGQIQQYGMMSGQSGPAQGYQNAVEPTHNGNFAWNGQPIPSYPQFVQAGQGSGYPLQQFGQVGQGSGYAPQQFGQAGQGSGYAPQQSGSMMVSGQQPFMTQALSYTNQTFQGGLPVPGSSGNMNAPYGSRNTGINNADARNVGFQGGYTGYGPNGQPLQYGTFMRDGTQYGAGPHTIDPNKAIIRGVHYQDGAISAVQFQDGSVADIASAIAMAEAGMIEDVNTGRNREGQKTLRSYPDGDPSNNLSSLPRF